MPTPTAVLNVVGLTESLLPHAPRLSAMAKAGATVRLRPVLPAVTCSVQASMVTGLGVADHGIVGNGWYDRETAEVRFWQRSNRLVRGEQVWDTARRRDAGVTCANLFWWFNSYSSCEYVVQARPIYKADGRKLPDCYAEPDALRDELQGELGAFPLFRFWGPLADITSTRWIADAAKRVAEKHSPKLTLVYLPHLDYGLQKLGPDHPDIPKHVAEVDAVVADLVDALQGRGVRVLIVSEYGIEAARPDGAVAINRILRAMNLLAVREEDGLEVLDPGASVAFAVADHQVAHVYFQEERLRANSKASVGGVAELRSVLAKLPGIDAATTIAHARAGEIVLVALPGHWFTYDYWGHPLASPVDHSKAPDFARTVDIHRKPGYDPRELFSDKSAPAVAWKLAKRKLGFRQLLDVVPLDTSLVKGTHGRPVTPRPLQPLLIVPEGSRVDADEAPCEAVRDVILSSLFDEHIHVGASGPSGSFSRPGSGVG